MVKIRFRIIQVVAAICATLVALPAGAQDAGNPWDGRRAVTIIVPYAAGGSVDAMARALAQGITKEFNQAAVVENVSGAEGWIGTRRAMESQPDGYTLLVQVPSITVMGYLPGSKGADPLAQLAPVTSVAESPVLLVGSTKIPSKNFKEFVEYCRSAAKPCSTGSGESLSRIRAQQIAAEANLPSLVNIPYRGTAPAVTDLIAGHIDLTLLNFPSALPHVQAGTVRILAVQDMNRAPQVPDVPTTVELGYPQFQMVSWFGVFAPKSTPQPMLHALAKALSALKDQPELLSVVKAAGASLVLNSPDEFGSQVKKDTKTWSELAEKYPLN